MRDVMASKKAGKVITKMTFEEVPQIRWAGWLAIVKNYDKKEA